MVPSPHLPIPRRCLSNTFMLCVFIVLGSTRSIYALIIASHSPPITKSVRSFNDVAGRRPYPLAPQYKPLRKTAYTKLFASPSNDASNDNSPKKNPVHKLRILLLSLYNLVITAPFKLKTFYKRLSKKARIIISFQLILLTSILGWGVKTAVMDKRVVVKPVEVPYSTFLDLVDVNGKVKLMCSFLICLNLLLFQL